MLFTSKSRPAPVSSSSAEMNCGSLRREPAKLRYVDGFSSTSGAPLAWADFAGCFVPEATGDYNGLTFDDSTALVDYMKANMTEGMLTLHQAHHPEITVERDTATGHWYLQDKVIVEAFKFDLKAATPDGWAWLTKVKDPAPALAAAVRAQETHGCHVEVVSNIVPGLNDDDVSIKTMAGWVRDALGPKTPWHVTRFLPEFELSYLPATPIKTLEKAVALGKREGLQFVYAGNVPGHPGRDTLCPACGRKAIERDEQMAHNLLVRDGLCGACGEDLNVVDGWQ